MEEPWFRDIVAALIVNGQVNVDLDWPMSLFWAVVNRSVETSKGKPVAETDEQRMERMGAMARERVRNGR